MDEVSTRPVLMPADTPDCLADAWTRCIAHALSEAEMRAIFEAKTGLRWVPPVEALKQAVVEATGRGDSYVEGFVRWANTVVWAEVIKEAAPDRIAVPPAYTIKLSKRGSAFLVTVTPADMAATPEAVAAPGVASCLLLLDAGEAWPDFEGALKANVAMRHDYPVVFAFHARTDAKACQDRLTRERAQ